MLSYTLQVPYSSPLQSVNDLSVPSARPQVPYFPPLQCIDDYSPEVCRQLIATAAGLPDLQPRVETVRTWTMSAQVAQRWASK